MGAPMDEGCSCSEARAHLEAFLDHECDAETHLREILRSRCVEQAPPELRARVLGRLSVMRSTASVTTAGGTMTVRSSVIRYTRG